MILFQYSDYFVCGCYAGADGGERWEERREMEKQTGEERKEKKVEGEIDRMGNWAVSDTTCWNKHCDHTQMHCIFTDIYYERVQRKWSVPVLLSGDRKLTMKTKYCGDKPSFVLGRRLTAQQLCMTFDLFQLSVCLGLIGELTGRFIQTAVRV